MYFKDFTLFEYAMNDSFNIWELKGGGCPADIAWCRFCTHSSSVLSWAGQAPCRDYPGTMLGKQNAHRVRGRLHAETTLAPCCIKQHDHGTRSLWLLGQQEISPLALVRSLWLNLVRKVLNQWYTSVDIPAAHSAYFQSGPVMDLTSLRSETHCDFSFVYFSFKM